MHISGRFSYPSFQRWVSEKIKDGILLNSDNVRILENDIEEDQEISTPYTSGQ